MNFFTFYCLNLPQPYQLIPQIQVVVDNTSDHQMQALIQQLNEMDRKNGRQTWHCNSSLAPIKKLGLILKSMCCNRMSRKSVATCYWFQIFYTSNICQQNLKPDTCEPLQYQGLHKPVYQIYGTAIMYLRQVPGFNIDIYIILK